MIFKGCKGKSVIVNGTIISIKSDLYETSCKEEIKALSGAIGVSEADGEAGGDELKEGSVPWIKSKLDALGVDYSEAKSKPELKALLESTDTGE